MGAPRAVFGALAEKATVKQHKENAEHRTLNAQHRMEESAICNLSPLTSLVTAASGNPIIRRSTFDVQRSAFGVLGKGRRPLADRMLSIAPSPQHDLQDRLPLRCQQSSRKRDAFANTRDVHSATLRAGSVLPRKACDVGV